MRLAAELPSAHHADVSNSIDPPVSAAEAPAKHEALLGALKLDDKGLVTAIAQDALTGEIRMVAHMNRDAFSLTLSSGVAHFYSRSRNALWKKGESSGNTLAVRAVFLDCDGDAVLLHVEPAGPSCHTGTPSCFFRNVQDDGTAWSDGARPLAFAQQLESTLVSRKTSGGGSSYTRKLLDGGAPAIGAKMREEADELARAIATESDDHVAREAADVVYHLMVGLISRAVPWRSVLAELARRFGTSGIVEKASRATHGRDGGR